MNRKLLSTALLVSLGLTHAANAQEFDDRWYLTGTVGYNLQDGDRRTSDAPMVAIGLGKFITPQWSIDGEFNYQNPHFDKDVAGASKHLNWPQYGFSVDVRGHLGSDDRRWRPYGLFGIGYQRVEESYNDGSLSSPAKRKDGNLAAKLGVGVQGTLGDRVAVRAEVAMRIATDDNSYAANTAPTSPCTATKCYPFQMKESYFTDTLFSVGVVLPLGPKPVNDVPPPPPPPAPPPPPPAPPAPPPPPPPPITIDLNGVNFDFDKSALRPDAVQILNEAVSILQRYPDMKVEVAGHTDSVGTEAYNQRLSERRAQAVYDFLTSHGITADRLVGPVGYGQTRPIAPNDTSEGRAKNRRTELNTTQQPQAQQQEEQQQDWQDSQEGQEQEPLGQSLEQQEQEQESQGLEQEPLDQDQDQEQL